MIAENPLELRTQSACLFPRKPMSKVSASLLLLASSIFLASCRDTTPRSKAPAPAPSRQAISIENELTDHPQPTLLLQAAAESPVPWQTFDEDLFTQAKAEGKLICLVVSGLHPGSTHLLLKRLDSDPTAWRDLSSFSLPTLVDHQLHPAALHFAARRLSVSGQDISFPAFVFLSPEGHAVSFSSLPDLYDGNTVLGSVRSIAKTVNGLWSEDPGYVSSDSASKTETFKAGQVENLTTKAPLVTDLADASAMVTRMSSLYDSLSQRFEVNHTFLPIEAFGFMLRGAALKNTPDYVEKRTNEAVIAATEAIFHSPLYDPLDDLVFSRYRSQRGVLPTLSISLRTNADFAGYLMESLPFIGDRGGLWQAKAEAILGSLAKKTSDGLLPSNQLPTLDPDELADHFLWTHEELQDALSAEEYKLVRRHCEIPANIGNAVTFGDLVKINGDKSYLWMPADLAPAAATALEAAFSKLAAVRLRKEADELPASTFFSLETNAAYAATLFSAYRMTAEDDFFSDGAALLDRILEDLSPDEAAGHFSAGWSGGKPVEAAAQAVAITHLLKAALTAYEVSGEERFLAYVETIASYLQARHARESYPLVTEEAEGALQLSEVVYRQESLEQPATGPLIQSLLPRISFYLPDLDLSTLQEKLENFRPRAEGEGPSPTSSVTAFNAIIEKVGRPQTFIRESSASPQILREEILEAAPLTRVSIIDDARFADLAGSQAATDGIVRMTETLQPISASPAVNPLEDTDGTAPALETAE